MGAKGCKDVEQGKGHRIVDEAAILSKLNRNILAMFFVMTVLCYIDRTNLAFAALQLNTSLGFTEKVYGIGSSAFFVGYSLFQIPSNMILVRVGAPKWLSIIVVSWGVCATLFAAMKTETEFYVLRFLLGITECGTFPGMWFHMSLFYSEKDIAMAYSWISAGTALSQVFGSPLAAALLSLDGLLGIQGWQWLFILEGVPTIGLGVYIMWTLPASPAEAAFLTEEERQWVLAKHGRGTLGKAKAAGDTDSKTGCWGAASDWRTYHVALIACMESTVKTALLYWSPLIIGSLVSRAWGMATADGHESGGSSAMVALLTVLPFGLAAAWMPLLARSSQRTGERQFHCFVPFLMAAGALCCMAKFMQSDPSAAFASLLVATVLWGPAGIIYSLPATFLQGPSAATGIALINSLASVGGMIGPALTGHLKAETGNYGSAIMVLACVTLVAACLVFVFPMAGQPDDARMPLPQTASNSFLSAKLSRFRDSVAHVDKADMIGTAIISGTRKGAE